MSLAWFPIAVLGVWRITHLLVAEDGPADLVARMRTAASEGFLGKLLDCFYCLSLWVAVPFAMIIGESWVEHVLLWPALSAGAILAERLTNSPQSTVHGPQPASPQSTVHSPQYVRDRERDRRP